MSPLWVIVIILLILAVFGVPSLGPWHHNYGYYPSGALVLIAIVLALLLLY